MGESSAGYRDECSTPARANTGDKADSIRQMLPQLTESLPKSVKVTVLSDRTTNIRASVRDTQFELDAGDRAGRHDYRPVLRNIRHTIIPGVASLSNAYRHLCGDGGFLIFPLITRRRWRSLSPRVSWWTMRLW